MYEVSRTLRRSIGVAGGGLVRLVADESGPVVRSFGLTRVTRHGWPSQLLIGDRVTFGRGVRMILHEHATISIGDNVYVNDGVRIEALHRVSIGARCLLAPGAMIFDSDLHDIEGATRTGPVELEERVWLGARAVVLQGVTIGAGAIIAAGAVVVEDVEPGTQVAGVPARVVKRGVSWQPTRTMLGSDR